MSIFNFNDVKGFINHPETKKLGMKVARVYLSKNTSTCHNISLLNKSLIVVDLTRLYVPRQARNEILRRLHISHPGYNRMVALYRKFFYWKNATLDIKNELSLCKACRDHRAALPPAPMVSAFPVTAAPWSRVSLDIFYGKDNTYFLAIICNYSSWIDCKKLRDMTTTAVINALQPLLNYYGNPVHIRTDSSRTFLSKQFQDFLTERGIHHETSSSYHQSANGAAEASVKACKLLLSKLDWNYKEFSQQLAYYNAIPKADSGISPSEMFLARQIRLGLPGLPEAFSINAPKAIKGGHERLKSILSYQQSNNGQPLEDIPVGTKVAIYNFKPSPPRWTARGTVVMQDRKEENGALRYVVRLADSKTLITRTRVHLLPINSEELEQSNYIIEKFGALQLSEDNHESLAEDVKNYCKFIWAPKVSPDAVKAVNEQLKIFEDNVLTLQTINKLQKIVESKEEALARQSSFDFFPNFETLSLQEPPPQKKPRYSTDEFDQIKIHKPVFPKNDSLFLVKNTPDDASKMHPVIQIPKVMAFPQYFNDSQDTGALTGHQMERELAAKESSTAAQLQLSPPKQPAMTYAAVARRRLIQPTPAWVCPPAKDASDLSDDGRKTGAKKKATIAAKKPTL